MLAKGALVAMVLLASPPTSAVEQPPTPGRSWQAGSLMSVVSYGAGLSNAELLSLAGGLGTALPLRDDWGAIAMLRASAGLGGAAAAASLGVCAFIQEHLCIFGGALQFRVLRAYWLSPWPDAWYAGGEAEILVAMFRLSAGMFWPAGVDGIPVSPGGPRLLFRLSVGLN